MAMPDSAACRLPRLYDISPMKMEMPRPMYDLVSDESDVDASKICKRSVGTPSTILSTSDTTTAIDSLLSIMRKRCDVLEG